MKCEYPFIRFKMGILIFIISFALKAQTPLPCALSGTYTVNSSQPVSSTNFATIKAAIDKLDSCGVSGHVTINLASGTYNEQVVFKDFPGLSDTSTVTLQADPSNTSPAEIFYPGSSAVIFDTTSYITLKGLSLQGGGSSGTIDLAGFTDHINLEDNFIISTSSYSIYATGWTLRGVLTGILSDCTIKGNIIKGHIYMAGWQSSATTIGAGTGNNQEGNITRTTIEGNDIEGNVFISNHNYPVIENNIIRSSSSLSFFGNSLVFAGTSYKAIIRDNRIITRSGSGITVSNVQFNENTLGSGGTVVNNMVSALGSAIRGIAITSGSTSINYVDVLHNSVLVNSSDQGAKVIEFIENEGSTGNRLLNNSFVNKSGGRVIALELAKYPNRPDYFTEADHNNYYTTGDTLGNFGEEIISDLQDWQITTLKDAHAISLDPLYQSDTNLTPSSLNLINGMSLPIVPSDINGTTRSEPPSLGAVEVVTTRGSCNPFFDFVIDSIKGNNFNIDWIPGAQSSSYYIEYGPVGFIPGGTGGTVITGTYPGSGPPVKISGLSPDTPYDIYFGEICNSGSDSVYFNKRSVTTSAPCPSVGGIETDSTGIHSASFTLASLEDSFEVEWGHTGYGQGTGTSMQAGRSFTLDSLDDNVTYDLYIRASCGTNWFGPFTFTTEQDCDGPLSGNYTIGGPTGPRNFSTFNEAVDLLNNCGVSGPVVIDVTGTTGRNPYKENFVIKDVLGVSSVNTITIQAQSPFSDPVELEYAASDVEDNYVILFHNASHITIKNLKIEARGNDYANVIAFSGEGEHVHIKNNEITGKENAQDYLPQTAIRSLPRSEYSYCEIDSNTIRKGFTSVYSFSGVKNAITNNYIEDFSFNGIEVYDQDSILIEKNIITPSPLYAAILLQFRECIGIYLDEASHFKVLKNQFRGSLETPDRYTMKGVNLASSTSGLIANNMISTSSNLTVATFAHKHGGIDLSYGANTDIDIVHNSVITRATWTRPVYVDDMFGDISGIRLLNNNLVSDAVDTGEVTQLSVAIEIGEGCTQGIEISDHNNLYSNGNLGIWGAASAHTLSDWQNLSGQDSNSVTTNPHFAGEDDLHVSSSGALYRRGIPFNSVTTDIDDEDRLPGNPDIGADEFPSTGCYSSYDLKALEIYSDSILFNWKPGTGLAHHIQYDTAGFTMGTGIILQGIADTLFLIKSLSPATSYDFYIQDSCGIGDTSYWVGPVTYTTPCRETDILSGTYTIDSSRVTGNGNFSSFNEAVATMSSCGIKGPVIFNVAEGTYIEQIELSNIEGVSEVNTITFQADPSNDTAVYLKYSGGAGNNYVIRFNNIDHIIVKGLSISAVGVLYGTAIHFKGNCSDIAIKGNEISGISSNRTISDMDHAVISNPNEGENLINNIEIIGNKIYNGSNAIYWIGDPGDPGKEDSTIVENNMIENFSGSGIYMENQGNTFITSNRLEASNGMGLRILACSNTRVYNNIISTTDNDGIYFLAVNGGYLFYNTVNVKGSGSALHLLYSATYAENNNFINSGTGYAANVLPTPFGFVEMNYNNLFSTGMPFCNWSGSEIADLPSWRTASGADSNSISVDPLFISPDSLYSTSPLLNDKGNPFADVSDDIDDNPRSATTPDIGANEFNPLEKDLILVSVTEPSDSNCGDTDAMLSVVITNAGSQIASGFTIGAAIRGLTIANPFLTYSGSLNSGASDTVSLTSINTVSGGLLQITSYVHQSGDLRTMNDTVENFLQIEPSELLSPSASIGFFCENGVYDTLYFPANIEDSLLTWLTVDGDTISSNDSLVVGPLGETDTTFILSSSGEGCYAGGEITIEASEQASASFTVSLHTPEMTKLTAVMNAGSSTGANTYEWDFGDGTTGTGDTVSHDYTSNGMYDVQLIVTGNCGRDTLTKTIQVSGIHIKENILSRSLEIYPNPTSGELRISFETWSSGEAQISVIDLSGKVIYARQTEGINGRYEGGISFGNYARGVYILKVATPEMKATRRIIKN